MDTSGLLLAQNYHLCPSPFFSALSSPNCRKFSFFFFARNMTLFVELTDWEDGRLAPQNNHLLQKNFWYHCPIGPGICDQSWPVQWRDLILIYVCVCFLSEISLTYNIKLVSSVQNNSIFLYITHYTVSIKYWLYSLCCTLHPYNSPIL